jgi:hypothetical protein
MSWFSKNYEKAALVGAVLVAIGLVYFGIDKIGGVKKEFEPDLTGRGNNKTAVPGAERIPMALQSMKLDRSWKKALDGDRPVDLFTGIALFIKSSEPEKPVDLIKGDDVHPPIKNIWWIENRIDPGFADSPQRDPDEDGFSNIDEFTAKTDPNNDKSHPSLIAKLKFLKDESIAWVIRPGFGDNGKFPFNYEDAKGRQNRISAANAIGEGELFFPQNPEANRFKLLGSELRREVNPRTQAEREITYVTIEDQRPNKTGLKYEFPAPLQNDERKNRYVQHDRTAVFSLEALGLDGKEFRVEENTSFALPPSAAQKNYLLKTVTPDSVIVEYPDAAGGRATVTINKGAMPAMNL